MENLTNISIELNQQFNTKEEAIRFCGEKTSRGRPCCSACLY